MYASYISLMNLQDFQTFLDGFIFLKYFALA